MTAMFSTFFDRKNSVTELDPHEKASMEADIHQRLAYISPAFSAGDRACTEIVDTAHVVEPPEPSWTRRLKGIPIRLTDRIRARIRWNRSARMTLAIVMLAVAAVSVGSAWWAWPRPEPSLVAPVAHTETGDDHGADAAVDEPTGTVTVSVVGDVHEPGLVSLPEGSRVADAIAAAGGPTVDDTGYLNLARKVDDGELVIVGEAPAPEDPASDAPRPAASDGAVVNLNQATLADLDALPGIGPVMAQRIIDYRDANGGFDSVDQLEDVEGVGPNTMQKLRKLVTI